MSNRQKQSPIKIYNPENRIVIKPKHGYLKVVFDAPPFIIIN